VDKEAKLNQQQPSASTTRVFDAAAASARAREMFREAYKRDPEGALEERYTELCVKAEGCEVARDFEGALRYASEALALMKRMDEVPAKITNGMLFYVGKHLFYNDRFAEAIEHYDKVLASEPKTPEVLYFKGKVLSCMKDIPGAIRCYDAAFASKPACACAAAGKAVALCLERKPEAALALLDTVSESGPWKAELLEARADALYGLARDKEALAVLEELDRARPDDVGTHVFKGAVLGRLGRHKEELAHLDHALELNPVNEEALARHAVCLLNLGRTDEARDALRSFRPSEYDSLFWECAVDFVCGAEYSKSLPLLDYLDRYFTKEPDVKFVRAAALVGLGRYTEAESILEIVGAMGEGMPAEASRQSGHRCASLIRHLVERGNVECALQLESIVFNTPTTIEEMRRKPRRGDTSAKLSPEELRANTTSILNAFPAHPYSTLSGDGRGRFHNVPIDRFFSGEAPAATAKSKNAKPNDAKPQKSAAKVAEEKRQKGIARSAMQLAEARAELADSRNRLIETEMGLADAEKSEKESKHKLQQLAEKHSLRTWDDEARAVFLAKCERARKECAGLEATRKSLATELEGCEAAVGAYMREREIDETDDSLLILHMRSNMRRGAQRDKLENSVERRRQARMQLRYYDGRISEANAERERTDKEITPLLELDAEATTASREAAALREKKTAVEGTILSLKERVGILEAKAKGNGN